jgi:outer membrane protein assembly factor BamE (lipoprotein component of BamABCDE complex)
MKNKSFVKPLLIGLSLTALAACTPITAQRGNMLEDYQLQEVKAGENTRSDIIRLLGSPTTKDPFHDDVWYYIGQETEKRGILDPEVVKERIVVVQFDPDGYVGRVADVVDGHIEVPVSRDSTPTYGNDLTVIQQLLGNIGKFNPQEDSGK